METTEQSWTDTYNNWEYVQQHLKLRIYPKSFREKLPNRGYINDLLYKIDFEDTFTMLVLEYEGRFAPLQKSQAALWGKNLHQIYDTAQENTNKEKFEITEIELAKRNQLFTIHNESFAPSFLLGLPLLAKQMIGKAGSLIGIPAQNMVFAFPLNHAEAINNCHLLNENIKKIYEYQANQISQTIYWYFEQMFYPLPARSAPTDNVCVNIPPKLRMILEEMK